MKPSLKFQTITNRPYSLSKLQLILQSIKNAFKKFSTFIWKIKNMLLYSDNLKKKQCILSPNGQK